MPLDIEGWVEMSRLDLGDRNDAHAWSGVIRLGDIIDAPDPVSGALFGISKRMLTGHTLDSSPLAAARGFPTNPSEELANDIERMRKHEEHFGRGEYRGFTYVNYDELNDIDWTALGVENLPESDWALIFQLIDNIRNCPHLGESGFRIVCWAYW